MSNTTEPARVSVRILEKEFFVACPHEERAALLDAAEFLNGRMREIRDSGKVVGLDRVAVMAALNLANELLHIRGAEAKVTASAVTRVRAARERAEAALSRNQQLEL
jgi:cell division protein ZapA